MGFWQKKPLTSEEYADCLSKITKLTHEVAGMMHLLEKLDMRMATLQGNVSRKLGGSKTPLSSEGAGDIDDEELKALKDFVGRMGYTGGQ